MFMLNPIYNQGWKSETFALIYTFWILQLKKTHFQILVFNIGNNIQLEN